MNLLLAGVLGAWALDIQGHRGDAGEVPPGNTLPSFQSALKLGVTTLEGDMRFSQDGKVVMGHDDQLYGCAWAGPSPAPVLRISALTSAQIPQVDCHPEISGVQPPPLLPKVLDLHKGSPVHFNLEFKLGTTDNVRIYMAEIARYQAACGNCLTDRLIIQSFSYSALTEVKKNYLGTAPHAATRIRIAALGGNGHIPTLRDFADIYSPSFGVVTRAVVDSMHKAGLKVIPWTVNDVTDMRRLIDLGVDGIITDYPRRLVEVAKPSLVLPGTGRRGGMDRFDSHEGFDATGRWIQGDQFHHLGWRIMMHFPGRGPFRDP